MDADAPRTAMNDPVLRLALYWRSADLMRAHVDELRAPPYGLERVIEDGEFWRYHAYLTAWLGGLYVVAEGFTKLGLADDAVEALIAEHGDSLRRFRNAIYHFEMDAERQLQFLRGPPSHLNGAVALHAALRVFLLRHAAAVS